MRKNKALFVLIYTSVSAALCFVLTMVKIQLPTGMLHLGNVACVLTSFMFGPLIGGVSSSLGMGLYDLIFYPTSISSIITTFIAKFILGFLSGLLFKKITIKNVIVKVAIISAIVLLLNVAVEGVLRIFLDAIIKYSGAENALQQSFIDVMINKVPKNLINSAINFGVLIIVAPPVLIATNKTINKKKEDLD